MRSEGWSSRQEQGVLGRVTEEKEEELGCDPLIFAIASGPGLTGYLPLLPFGAWSLLFHNYTRSLWFPDHLHHVKIS